jgi:O-antigen biosynthesis protein WbqV
MTVREAVELVLEATVLGTDQGGGAAIFVLDMGEPIKIIDLAHQMIRLAGHEPDKDIAIEIIGLRPGEKLTEELFYESESTEATRYPGVLLARPRPLDFAILNTGLAEMDRAAHAGDADALRAALAQLAPDYRPIPAGAIAGGGVN